MAGFRTQKYRDAVRRAFNAKYTVAQVASARPGWARSAIQYEYDQWKAERGAAIERRGASELRQPSIPPETLQSLERDYNSQGGREKFATRIAAMRLNPQQIEQVKRYIPEAAKFPELFQPGEISKAAGTPGRAIAAKMGTKTWGAKTVRNIADVASSFVAFPAQAAAEPGQVAASLPSAIPEMVTDVLSPIKLIREGKLGQWLGSAAVLAGVGHGVARGVRGLRPKTPIEAASDTIAQELLRKRGYIPPEELPRAPSVMPRQVETQAEMPATAPVKPVETPVGPVEALTTKPTVPETEPARPAETPATNPELTPTAAEVTSPTLPEPGPEQGVAGGGEVAKLESNIASRTNAEIPPAELPMPGLTIKHVGNGPTGPAKMGVPSKGYTSPDPAIEQGFKDTTGGVKPITFTQHVKEGIVNLFHAATRTHADLPRNAEFAIANEGLRYIGHQRGVASSKTLRILQDVTLPLRDKGHFDLFRRKVVLDDLAQTAAKGEELPFGWTAEQVAAEKARVNAIAESIPGIDEAFTRRQAAWDAIKADYIKAMDEVGFNVSERLTREDYFHHQVLDYMNFKGIGGASKPLKVPTKRGFLKAREGSAKAISTNYLQAEWEVMAQMLHDTEIARVLKQFKSEYDVAGEIKAVAKTQGLEDWHDAIPDGMTTWQPRDGNIFYMGKSVSEKVAQQLLDGIGDTLNIKPEDIRNQLAMGGKRAEWVIPEELAKTLDTMSKAAPPARHALNARLMNYWKQYVLLNPRRLVKYNLRNLSGDAEMAFVGNPSTFREVPWATKETYQLHTTTRAPEGLTADWLQRGGQQGLLQAQEMGQLNELAAFLKLADKPKVTPTGVVRKYWMTARLATDFRESILRLASFKDYYRQVTSNPEGRPNNFGASIPEEVMAITDLKDRAYKLSNELLGAYDQVTELGKGLRTQTYPFWSWVEINFGRNIRLMRNAIAEGRGAGVAGRRIAAAVPKSAYSVGKLAIKASTMWALLQTYNNLRFPDEEKNLPDDIRAKPHLILGRSQDGTVQYISRLGAVADFLEWFGLDAPQQGVNDFLNGRKTISEIAGDVVKKPVNKAIQGLHPAWKAGTELLTGRTLFPNAFKPGRVRDKAEYLARQFSLDPEYKIIAGKPHVSYVKSLGKTLADQINPDQSAYYEILDLKYSYLEKKGKPTGFSSSPRSDKLYNYKQAKFLGDDRAAKRYLKEYYDLGGTDNGLSASLRSADPLNGLGGDKDEFLKSLTKGEKAKLAQAQKYFDKLEYTPSTTGKSPSPSATMRSGRRPMATRMRKAK